MVKHLVVVTCENSGFQGLYVDGDLVDQDDTIYAGDIAEHTNDGPVDFSHVKVVMPEGSDGYPKQFDQCMLWVLKEYEPIDLRFLSNPVSSTSELLLL